MDQLPTVGFVGLGVMGSSMAAHLLAAGHPLNVFTRTKEKAEVLLGQGARWKNTPQEVARDSDVIITIVGYPHDVEEVYLSPAGILAGVKSNSLLIDMTTSCPLLAQKIHKLAAGKSIETLDAPVSGGDIGAREARLSIMVGGSEKAFNRALPIFQKIGKNIVHQGDAGSGQHTKMCNQIAIASGMVAICEALAYAKNSGLDPSTVLKSIESGAAGSWSLSNLTPRILKEDFSPGFFVKHFIKDMKIALGSAEAMKLDLPGLSLAKSLYEKLASEGHQDSGTQALFKLYEK